MSAKELHLSVVDQNTVRVYTQLFLIFGFPDGNQAESAIKALAKGLQVTLTVLPFLAGTLRLVDSKSGKLSLTYPSKAPDVQSSRLLTSKHLPDFPHTYKQLKSKGMPPSAITSKTFCPEDLRRFRGVPEDGEGIVDFTKSEAPVMRIQAFFVPGGLILGIYTHHAVLDFSGMNKFWENFAQSVFGQNDKSFPCELDLPDQSKLRSQLDARIPMHAKGLDKIESYVNGKFEYQKTLPPGPETPRSQKLFVISAKRIRSFRSELQDQSGLQISICNVITALLWIHVTRARAPRLQLPEFNYEDSSIGISVNTRKRMTPQISDEYTGNMALFAKATRPIAKLIAEERVTSTTILATIKHIKAAIDQVDNDWVYQHLSFFKSVNPITDTECALRFGLGPDLYITSWMNFPALETKWNIPGTSSAQPEFIRRAYNPSDGGMNIMPRIRTPVDGVDAPYEVVVRLATEDMNKVLAEEGGLASWAERVID
ncbi:trichothecene 3-O-acetyltransferas-like protein [Melanomma pulvis-pyrius CBS 109.77]|uniref:Trichothecene 3-O-acetyltransferas-like protein n=1 Tax=Melanomma pulvis-pyrius CBS 109.77 TaxID=1314802 RepID=A0A6A6X2V5_9PLEO|nr:trichothecene 3-O-acetyltransferas-like protein [Melanomma pulvis-pyrius CBS 109.77]